MNIFNRGPKLWQSGIARRALMGREPTSNPTLAASALLRRAHGARRVTRAVHALHHARRRFHKSNPVPAAIALALKGGLGKKAIELAGKLGLKKDTTPQRVAEAEQALATIASPNTTTAQKQQALGLVIHRHDVNNFTDDRHGYAPILRQLEIEGVLSGTRGARQVNQYKLQQLGRAPAAVGTPGPSFVESALGSPLAGKLGVEFVKQATKRPRRQRYPTYVDRYGRQRYSTKPPGSPYKLPAGATPAPGTPYSFFTGKLGAGGAAATAGQLAVAGAAGVAAYLVTQRLLQHLGGRAQRAEEAGVNAALAFREARSDFQRQHGRAPNKSEVAEMSAAYKAQLVALGYDPVTFTRKRGAAAEFLETYNPFGG